MKIYLCAREDDLFNAWKFYCDHHDFVVPTRQDIMSIDADAIVSPANSFGHMSGGIDLLYRNYFGKVIESDLRNKIHSKFNNELYVGQATSIRIFSKPPLVKYKYMISAPTMRVPENISHTINAFLAIKAALIEAKKVNAKSIVFPGMGTGTGCLKPKDCAKQMNAAINYVFVDKRIYTIPESLYEEQVYIRNNVATEKWFKVQMIED